jgi:hypothetical protein
MRTETDLSGHAYTRGTLPALSVSWRALSVPVHSVLALLEPLVSVVLGLLALLGICMSLAFRFLRPNFPFWTMMATSLAFLVALMLYHGLLRMTENK